MEAHKAVLFFHQEKNESCDPTKHITQARCHVLVQPHRSRSGHRRSILRLTILLTRLAVLLARLPILLAWLTILLTGLTVLLAAIRIGGLWWWGIAAVLAWLIWILSLITHDISLSLFTNIRPQ